MLGEAGIDSVRSVPLPRDSWACVQKPGSGLWKIIVGLDGLSHELLLLLRATNAPLVFSEVPRSVGLSEPDWSNSVLFTLILWCNLTLKNQMQALLTIDDDSHVLSTKARVLSCDILRYQRERGRRACDDLVVCDVILHSRYFEPLGRADLSLLRGAEIIHGSEFDGDLASLYPGRFWAVFIFNNDFEICGGFRGLLQQKNFEGDPSTLSSPDVYLPGHVTVILSSASFENKPPEAIIQGCAAARQALAQSVCLRITIFLRRMNPDWPEWLGRICEGLVRKRFRCTITVLVDFTSISHATEGFLRGVTNRFSELHLVFALIWIADDWIDENEDQIATREYTEVLCYDFHHNEAWSAAMRRD